MNFIDKILGFEKSKRFYWSQFRYMFGRYISVDISDDDIPGFQKKYIRGKNPVPLVVWLELREIDSKEYLCVIERRFGHHSLNREDWYTRIVKQWESTEENLILANEFFDEYRKSEQ